MRESNCMKKKIKKSMTYVRVSSIGEAQILASQNEFENDYDPGKGKKY